MVHDQAPALRKTEMQQANQFYELGNAIFSWVTLSIRTLRHVCRTRLHKEPFSNTLCGSRLQGMFKNVNLNTPKEVLESVWVPELHA